MSAPPPISLLLLLLLLPPPPTAVALTRDGLLLLRFRSSLTGALDSLSNWKAEDSSPCSWTGVSCSPTGNITSLDLFNLSLTSTDDPSTYICRLPHLAHLSLSWNLINSSLSSSSFSSCLSLVYLDLSMNYLSGPLPASLPLLPSLLHLDLSSNSFDGKIPNSYGSFPKLQNLSLVYNLLEGVIPPSLGSITSLQRLDLAYNPFAAGPLPEELGNLTSLKNLWLSGCNLVGLIPSSIGKLKNLQNLDLSRNGLTGSIPDSIVLLSNADQILLYLNLLSGELPNRMRNLKNLRSFDASSNKLVGTIPPDLFQLPQLEILHLYNNSLVGELPASVAGAKKLSEVRLFMNGLTGFIPFDLGMGSPLKVVELSQNHFTGEIPRGVCDLGMLEQLVMIENELSGTLPEGLARCSSLQRLRLSTNRLSGVVPEGLWGLPAIYMMDLAGNSLSGSISTRISQGTNLSTLLLSDNNFQGSLPPGLGTLRNLQKFAARNNRLDGSLPPSLADLGALESLDLSNNSILGELPQHVKAWKSLTNINLAMNELTGSIPVELGELPVLSQLDLSNNKLTGGVPSSLQNLKLNLLNLSNNDLSGPLPSMFATASFRYSFLGNPGLCDQIEGLCPEQTHRSQLYKWVLVGIFSLAAIVLVVGSGWVYWRYRRFKQTRGMSKWLLTSFHKLGFTEDEIVDGLSEENVIGSGASGKVYKVVLNSGEVVAVKKLYKLKRKMEEVEGGDCGDEYGNHGDYGFEKEVSMLGSIRHKNIVRLWCSCVHKDCRLLVYDFMPNGSLGDMLHSSEKKQVLNWEVRYQIAVDTADGLAYLHHDCSPPVIHRDVKPNNILLDAHFHAYLSDFGVAKAVANDGSQPKSVSNVAGTHGYLAPEYAYTLRINHKSDIYSFGVVLFELVSGKPAINPEYGEKDLVKWIISTLDQKGVEHIIDQNLDISFKNEICQVLNIALQCTEHLPLKRPTMRKVVKMLNEVKAIPRKAKNGEKTRSQDLSPYYLDD